MGEENSEIGAFMAGFVIGGLVGAATALIFAPQTGSETRAQLTDKSVEFRRSSENRFLEYKDIAESARVQDTSGKAQERIRIVLDEGKKQTPNDHNGESTTTKPSVEKGDAEE
jgi:gas vesicle protein